MLPFKHPLVYIVVIIYVILIFMNSIIGARFFLIIGKTVLLALVYTYSIMVGFEVLVTKLNVTTPR